MAEMMRRRAEFGKVGLMAALDCATLIADAIEGPGFEYFTPELFPGGLDAKAMVVDKTRNCDQFLIGMAAFAASLRT